MASYTGNVRKAAEAKTFKCQFCDKECHFRSGIDKCRILKSNASPFGEEYDDCPFRITEAKFIENQAKYPYDPRYSDNHKLEPEEE